ncbi:MAG: hypothetical protein ACU0A6_15070 [Shimia sp.]|uniref:hypothetical protein n=1 Tax=Shimia sp. TaxID=1954381 RepID=UPI0040583FF9
MRSFLSYLPAVAAATSCFLVVPILAVATAPIKSGAPVIVVAGPWTNLVGIVESSGGRVIGMTRSFLGILGHSEDPDFEEKLRYNGAWLVLDGQVVAALCGVR